MSLWEIYKAKRLGYADDLWTSLIGHQLGGYSWQSDYETTPYLYRAMPNLSHYYNREIMEEVVGGSVGWNQTAKELNATNWLNESGTTRSFSDGVMTFVSTVVNNGVKQATEKLVPNHKYLGVFDAKVENAEASDRCRLYLAGDGMAPLTFVPTSSFARYTIINNAGTNVSSGLYFTSYSESILNKSVSVKNVNVFDLTQMFGSAIADYIYSLEQATAGSGVAWLKEHFPKMFGQYNPYDAGSIQSVSGLVSHDMTGFNQLNPYADKINGQYNSSAGEILPTLAPSATASGENPIVLSMASAWQSMTFISDELVANSAYRAEYKFSAPTMYDIRATAYVIDDTYTVVEKLRLIQGSTGVVIADAFTPTRAGLKFALYVSSTSAQTISIENFCVHLAWDGSRNGQYEPYRKSSYPLDSTLTLRGIPKLDNGKLYYDGDTYGADGSVIRKYGVVDLGSLIWQYASGAFLNDTSVTDLHTKQRGAKCVCAKYISSPEDGASDMADKTVQIMGGVGGYNLWIKDSAYNNGTAFKTAMSGVYLVYELATPTTETASPFTKTQLCDSGGTEEFVTSGIVSVGHKSKYAEK